MDLFHAGERAVQSRAGVDGEARSLGRGISDTIPPGAGPFLAAQRLAILAGMDQAGQVWASLVVGNPGFITSADPRTLRLAAGLSAADPLHPALVSDSALGVLVFDPERRRRLRINGRVVDAHAGAIEIRTEEVFGNCPKYIQSRAAGGTTRHDRAGVAARSSGLSADQRSAIEAADTFFIASVHADAGADASHRGGQPGFVQVVDERTLRIPDYAGNNMFQTLGNIAVDPRVGLLFVSFDTGTTLQLTGEARILWEPARAIEIEIGAVVEIAGRGPLGWRFVDDSPFNPSA